jgi:hypothetical protein
MRYMFVPLLAAVALLWPAAAAADNYVTQSHKVLCAVTPDPSLPPGDHVVCQGHFAQAPELGAAAVTDGDGAFRWELGNVGVGNPTTTMAYGQTYHHGNWTINPDETGTRFVNDRTGHGMFVSIDNVSPF